MIDNLGYHLKKYLFDNFENVNDHLINNKSSKK